MKASEVKDAGYYWCLSDRFSDEMEWAVVRVTLDYPELAIYAPGDEVASYPCEYTGEFFGPLKPPEKP